ncbi:hypothetical protein LSH36_814g00023 [Paralvinella palmiformis]|uniref:RRM domain-containing protein n=1 Tax=Paralvinella palmiformis TaxID=53620 RepID=A0AAD9IZC5_9ANNE|nr:hypothetical protein LSH36_814g00023 [Paralvinella palmiformis]
MFTGSNLTDDLKLAALSASPQHITEHLSGSVGARAIRINPDQSGYRHSNADRKRLQKGVSCVNGATHDPILGSSTGAHRIQAAEPKPDHIRVIYIGNMAKDSTTDDVRAHLNGVQIAGIADVVRLSSEGSNSSLFCVKMDNQLAEIAVFQTEKWPRGIQIRPYMRRRDQPGSRNGNVMRNIRTQNNRANFNHCADRSHFNGYHGRSGYPLTQRNQAGSNRRYSSNNGKSSMATR